MSREAQEFYFFPFRVCFFHTHTFEFRLKMMYGAFLSPSTRKLNLLLATYAEINSFLESLIFLWYALARSNEIPVESSLGASSLLVFYLPNNGSYNLHFQIDYCVLKSHINTTIGLTFKPTSIWNIKMLQLLWRVLLKLINYVNNNRAVELSLLFV